MDSTYESEQPVPGFRLQRLEVFNWGTFDSTDGHVHVVDLGGKPSLLVGQNGSGKSTLIDALLTLLVPSVTRNYNVAAGAKKTERSERSYLRGAYGRGNDGETKVKYLRPGQKHFAALLAVFHDEVLSESLTLCQVFHQTSDGGIDKTFAIAGEDHSLADDLQGVANADQLRARLKDHGYRTTKKYVEYERWLARRTGFRSKAMDMFNQTVAVKDIQSLNEFVRRHMLDANRWRDKVDRLLSHFDELATAHRELERVRRAQELLEPIAKTGKAYTQLASDMEMNERMIEASDEFFRRKIIALFTPEMERQRSEIEHLQSSKSLLADEVKRVEENLRRLQDESQGSGGSRGQLLKLMIEREYAVLQSKKHDFQTFQRGAVACGVRKIATSSEEFAPLRARLQEMLEAIEEQVDGLEHDREVLASDIATTQRQLQRDRNEFEQVQGGSSNLPAHLNAIRSQLCSSLGVAADALPFAAELIDVKSDSQEWQSAIEMVLRPFATSLLVTPEHYEAVRSFVDTNRICDARGVGQRLVYLRVDPSDLRRPAAVRDQDASDGAAFLHEKLEFRDGHGLSDWVRAEVQKRFPFRCCENAAQFDHYKRYAVTKHRHLKTNGMHHEKDDRPRTADPRNFVLGWKSESKGTVLRSSIRKMEADVRNLELSLSDIENQLQEAQRGTAAIQDALQITEFEAININRHQREIEALEKEQRSRQGSAASQRALETRLEEVEKELAELEAKREEQIVAIARLQQSLDSGEKLVDNASRLLGTRATVTGEADEVIVKALGPDPLSTENLFDRERLFNKQLHAQLAVQQRKIDPLTQQLVGMMGRYLREFPQEQDDLDARTDSLGGFLSKLQQIQEEDLPRYQHRFRSRLNDKIRQELALFYASLRGEAQQIEEKVAQLNRALAELEYCPGTYMRLDLKPVSDVEICEFQKQIADCLVEPDQASEKNDQNQYAKIEQLIQRLGDSERTRWRDKVIDVRRWFDYVACEVDCESEAVLSIYEDSSGQSGGEKAKLAFTILVAAIAYQYDLDPTQGTPGKFHFVCVDEMFSKVDDAYAEYAMRLFEQFGLQLLIVAPLDAKARVTEPFVERYLQVVKDPKASKSRIFTMAAKEYELVFAGRGVTARGSKPSTAPTKPR